MLIPFTDGQLSRGSQEAAEITVYTLPQKESFTPLLEQATATLKKYSVFNCAVAIHKLQATLDFQSMCCNIKSHLTIQYLKIEE